MTRSLVALWCTLLAAVATISVLAQFWVVQRRESARQRVREILASQLSPVNESIGRLVEEYSRTLQIRLSEHDLGDVNACYELTRSPLAQAVVVVNRDAQLWYPTDVTRMSTDRRTLVEEAQQLLREQGDPRPQSGNRQAGNLMPGADLGSLRSRSYSGSQIAQNLKSQNLEQFADSLPTRVAQQDADALDASGQFDAGDRQTSQVALPSADPAKPQLADKAQLPSSDIEASGGGAGRLPSDGEEQEDASEPEQFGWITWYHRRGMVLGFWWHQSDQWRGMVVLPRARWMADIVAAMPTLPRNKQLFTKSASPSLLSGSVRQLVDVEGNVIYQWGDVADQDWDALTRAAPAAELPVTNPFDGWRLRVYATAALEEQLAGDDLVTPIWLAVGAVALALVLGGALVTANLNRQFRLAASRVSFVNQVSHELRTPLTNICMYADLLAEDLRRDTDPADEATRSLGRVGVIQNESRRLNRLISNVLEFARAGTKPKRLRRAHCVLDELIREVLATFQPRLDELHFEVVVDLQTPHQRSFDPDVVEQIVVNLISNAEKYAAAGRYLEISTRGHRDRVEVFVKDAGPGVPQRLADRIFSPFERVSNRLEDPAGTGIGLTIARELARKHGGDCELLDVPHGAAFRCTLDAPLSSDRIEQTTEEDGSPK